LTRLPAFFVVFISLNVEPATHKAEVAAINAVGAGLEARGVPVRTAGGVTGC